MKKPKFRKNQLVIMFALIDDLDPDIRISNRRNKFARLKTESGIQFLARQSDFFSPKELSGRTRALEKILQGAKLQTQKETSRPALQVIETIQ